MLLLEIFFGKKAAMLLINSYNYTKMKRSNMENKIEKVLFKTIDQINEQFLDEGNEKKLNNSDDTKIIGDESILDSLDILNFVVALQENIAAEFGDQIELVNDELLSEENNPLSTVKMLKLHLLQILK